MGKLRKTRTIDVTGDDISSAGYTTSTCPIAQALRRMELSMAAG
jgi:hypothetical protein